MRMASMVAYSSPCFRPRTVSAHGPQQMLVGMKWNYLWGFSGHHHAFQLPHSNYKFWHLEIFSIFNLSTMTIAMPFKVLVMSFLNVCLFKMTISGGRVGTSRANCDYCHISAPRCFKGFYFPRVGCIVLVRFSIIIFSPERIFSPEKIIGDFGHTLLLFVFTSTFSTT